MAASTCVSRSGKRNSRLTSETKLVAENSKIEWTDHTFNPWVGCTKVSPACDNCYAESWAKRAGRGDLWHGSSPQRTSESNWRKPVKWNAEAMKTGKRARVFCASLADVFDNAVPAEWRSDLFKLIEATPHLDWLLLTKRIGNVRKLCGGVSAWPNVWLGATVVTQEEVDRDVPKLIATPAAVRFLSCEPLLEEISFRWAPWRPLGRTHSTDHLDGLRMLDWVIVGGESGSKARPMSQQWVEQIRAQCAEAGVAFFMKQGSAANWPAYKDFERFGDSMRVREWPVGAI